MEETFVVDKFIGRIKETVKPQWKAAFLGCFIIGVLTFGYTITNHFLTYDSMWNLVSDQDMITSGRQFLTYACGISTDYDLPWLNGILAIFYMSVASVIVVESLGIKSKTLAVLAGGILVTFPSMASTFCYTYTIDGYMLAVLLAAAAFLLTDRKKWGFVGGMVLLGISLGIYQAYFSFTILLCILKLLLNILEGEKIKNILIKALKYISMGVGSYIFYYVTLQIMLKIKGQQLSMYQGINNLESFSLKDIPAGVIGAIKEFFSFLRSPGALSTTNLMYLATILLIGLGVGIYLWAFVKAKLDNKGLRVLFVLLLLAATPVGVTLVYVMAPNMYFHLLMRLPWALFFVFVLALAEKNPNGEKSFLRKTKSVLSSAICILAVALISQFAITANVVSFNMEERYEKTYALCLRILDRLEQTEGYNTYEKIAFIGGGVDESLYPYTDLTSGYLKGYFGAEGVLCVNDSEKFDNFFYHYLNVTLATASQEEELMLIQTEEFKQMENFPGKNSIKKIGDIWVVKLNG